MSTIPVTRPNNGPTHEQCLVLCKHFAWLFFCRPNTTGKQAEQIGKKRMGQILGRDNNRAMDVRTTLRTMLTIYALQDNSFGERLEQFEAELEAASSRNQPAESKKPSPRQDTAEVIAKRAELEALRNAEPRNPQAIGTAKKELRELLEAEVEKLEGKIEARKAENEPVSKMEAHLSSLRKELKSLQPKGSGKKRRGKAKDRQPAAEAAPAESNAPVPAQEPTSSEAAEARS